jgi:hypothetical protein
MSDDPKDPKKDDDAFYDMVGRLAHGIGTSEDYANAREIIQEEKPDK